MKNFKLVQALLAAVLVVLAATCMAQDDEGCTLMVKVVNCAET